MRGFQARRLVEDHVLETVRSTLDRCQGRSSRARRIRGDEIVPQEDVLWYQPAYCRSCLLDIADQPGRTRPPILECREYRSPYRLIGRRISGSRFLVPHRVNEETRRA